MKKLWKTTAIAAGTLLVVGAAVIVGGCCAFGPLGPFPGPKLSGPVVAEPVADWSFVDAVKIIQLESHPEDPYSVNIWLTRVDDGIYVFVADDESSWIQNIAGDPRVRLRIDGRIYERRAVGIDALELKRAFLTALKAKYEGDMGFDPEFWQRGWDTGEFHLYRMDPR